MKLLSLFFLIFLFFLIPFVQASCLDIQTAKQTYFPGETFQAEISGNFSKTLTNDNIFFNSNDGEYFPVFTLQQVSSDKWIVFSDVIKSYGQNSFSVRDVLCQGKILTKESKQINFSVKNSFNEIYSSTIKKISSFDSLDVEDNALALMDFSYDSIVSEEAKESLLSKSFENQCFPKDCKVKETSLSLLALNKQNYNSDKIKSWLLDSENNIKIGLWDLILNSEQQQTCSLIINNQTQSINLKSGSNSISLNLPDDSMIYLSLDCNLKNSTLSHTYLGNVHNTLFVQSVSINNQKCWGISYKTECNALSTAYALLALKSSGSFSSEISWLSKNSLTTEEKAFSNLFSSDFSDYLTNNQAQEGFWTINSLAVSNTPDIKATVAVLRTLTGSLREKGESWLISQLQDNKLNLKDTLYALQILDSSRLEPILSFSKGFIKTPAGTSFTIPIKNNGILSLEVSAIMGSKTSVLTLFASEKKDLVIESPSANSISFSYLELNYKNNLTEQKSYRIPVLVYPKTSSPQQIDSFLTNSTSPVLIKKDIRFVETNVNKTLKKDTRENLTITMKNFGNFDSSISLTFSSGLFGIIDRIEPAEFVLKPLETKQISILLDSSKAFGLYEGTLNSESSSLPISIQVYTESAVNQTKTETPKTPSTSKSNFKTIGIIMIVFALLAVGIFIYIKLRKKPRKPELLQALEKLKKESI